MEGSVADAGSYSLLPSAIPTIYCPFEGSVTDAQGFSTVTATGSPAYTTNVRVGATGTQAINLANTLSSGVNATQYVRGTWAGSSSWTVSFWFNMQSYNTTQGQSVIFSTYSGTVLIIVYNTSLSIYAVSGGTGAIRISSSSIPSTSTWHYVSYVHQNNGVCALYLNNALVGTYTNSGGIGTSSGIFSLGVYDNSLITPFNGFIDDFRLFNSAVPYVPVSVIQPVGTMRYVPGAVGRTALNLANTTAGTPSNYLTCSHSSDTDITVSFWCNIQRWYAGDYQCIFSIRSRSLFIYTADDTRQIICSIPTGSGTGTTNLSFNNISLSTWYHIVVIFKLNGTCSAYGNGTLLGTVSNSGGWGTHASTGVFRLGSYDYVLDKAFSGYIDDFRLYNSAVPYNSLAPMNLSHFVASANLAYQMAANPSTGQLWLSSNAGQTWAAQANAATPGAWSSLSASYSGQYLTAQSQPVVQPNQTGLAAATWSQQGVTYTVTASSTYAGFVAYHLFDNTVAGWNSAVLYNTAGTYTGVVSTTVQGIGAVTGEWFQLQTSIPLVLSSYRLQASGSWQAPKTYYIVGSNDGSTWYPLQYCVFQSNPNVSTYAVGTNVIVNYSGVQIYYANINTNLTTTAYATSTSSYLYFRMIALNTFNNSASSDSFSLSQFLPNFLGGCIMPNQSGLAAASWANSGVGWTASASSSLTNYDIYRLFNNQNASNGWANSSLTYNASGAYTGAISTTIQGIGAVLGEWAQLQGSMPLVLQAYTYTAGGSQTQFPKTYYLCGSNDNSTWYPLQYVSMTTTPFTAASQACTTNIIMNYSGTQTIQGGQSGSGTTTAYAPYVTQAWQYFRMVATSTYGTGSTGYVELNEFYPLFTAGQTSSTNSGLTWTPTLQTGDAFNVTKNLTVTSAGTGFATLPAFTPVSTGLTMSAWFTLQNVPATYSSLFSIALTTPNPTSAIHSQFESNGSITIFQRVSGATTGSITTTTTFATGIEYSVIFTIDGSGNHRVYINGTQNGNTSTGAINVITYPFVYIGKSNWSADPYPNMTVRDFRMFNRALNAAEVQQLYANQNYGQPALGPLTLSESGEYALAANQSVAAVGSNYLINHRLSTYTNPLLAGINAPIVDTAVSQTGQYMVLVTSGTTNNVYYSRDFGNSFTGLTLGTSAMTACAISHDGSYLTATNDTTTYTLNANATGYTLALGANAGQVNQASNAIAIGNLAGQTNQSANSIVLNASGSALNAASAGFYVSPISGPSGLSMNLLGYGADKQVTTTGVTVLPGGNVGIGTTSPNQLLDITNSLSLTPSIRLQSQYSAGYLSMGAVLGVNSYIGLQAGVNTSSALGTPTLVVTNAGTVGIGTTNPSTGLDVWGDGITMMRVTHTSSPTRSWFTGSDGGGAFIVYTSGLVGVYLPWGNTSWVSNSDVRLKRDMLAISSSLEQINQLRPITYHYITDDSSIVRRSGFIAQEVASVFPMDSYQIVVQNNIEQRTANGDVFYPLSLSMTEMIPFMVRAIQEVSAENKEVKTQVTALQSELTSTKASLASLLAWAQAQGYSAS